MNWRKLIGGAAQTYAKSQGVPLPSSGGPSDNSKLLASIDRRLAELQASVDQLIKLHRATAP